MAALRAVLADEQELFTEGLQRLLLEVHTETVEVIAAARSGEDLVRTIEREDADLILFELNFADIQYAELIQKLKSVKPQAKLIIVSAYGDMKLVRSCFNLGVDGYLLKSNSVEDLKRGISEVMQGQVFMGTGLKVAPPSNSAVDERQKAESEVNDRFVLKQKLTKREIEILGLICSGMNNRQISKELFISDQTVGVHKKNIMKKLKVNSTPDLVKFVKENKIVE
jgi:DNA-binding NarL/FixJ family response regulator